MIATPAKPPTEAQSAGAPSLISHTNEWKRLKDHVATIKETHLRDLLKDESRNSQMVVEHNGLFLDFTRQNMTPETISLLFELAQAARLDDKIKAMSRGDHINTTEDRAVMHVALRAARDDVYMVDGQNVVTDVYEVLDRVKAFVNKVRSGEFVGATGKKLTDVIAIGIGGSYLGPKFVFEALRTDPAANKAAEGRRLRFLANVDPVDFARCLEGYDPETTLGIIISKTFTTTETMLNARTLKDWFAKGGITDISKNVIAVSTNEKLVREFGIEPENMFGFWDWVGGRYSVSAAVGVVPLALQFGYETVERFLAGARDIDRHFLSTPIDKNIPCMLGLIGVWNASFMARQTRALLPYAQALLKLAPHIQQVAMESNGKHVALDGTELDFEAGEIEFGEPGTDGQHSFYQLIHQGRVVPCDFIGFVKSPYPIDIDGEPVNNHDELMSNFFAQPDALAFGKTPSELRAEGTPEWLIPHKTFTGNRPSLSLLFPGMVDAYSVGQVLSMYEHRTAVEGFIWGINSFDQWGVELGKVLATQVRNQLSKSRKEGAPVEGFAEPTVRLVEHYLKISSS